MCPIQHLLKHCLYPHILDRCSIVNAHLLRVFVEHFRLRDYFKAIQVTHVMFTWLNEVFEKQDVELLSALFPA